MENTKVWYIDPRSGKIDKNYYYDADTAVMKALEVASYIDRWVRVYSVEPSSARQYYARVYPDGKILKDPQELYDAEKELLLTYEQDFSKHNPEKIRKIQNILKQIGENIF